MRVGELPRHARRVPARKHGIRILLMDNQKIQREITIFPAEGSDELLDCVPITEPQFLAIARLLGFDTHLPLVDVYPIPAEVVPRVNQLLGKQLPTGALEFFLESYAE
jgi:hypothetical protein